MFKPTVSKIWKNRNIFLDAEEKKCDSLNKMRRIEKENVENGSPINGREICL